MRQPPAAGELGSRWPPDIRRERETAGERADGFRDNRMRGARDERQGCGARESAPGASGRHRMRRVTIKDVAAAAGVSIGTASKALNGQGKLRPETRDRVAQA